MTISLRVLTQLLLWLLAAAPLEAHDSRPLYIEINEVTEGAFNVKWKTPVSLPVFAIPMVDLPESCAAQTETTLSQQLDAYINQTIYRCEDGLSGRKIKLSYPNNNPSISALIRVKLWNGESYSQILRPDELNWTVPEAETFSGVSRQYTVLGIEHIFAGIDHLLFVACLIFIARTPRRILITITGFTVAHSLTLALSTLGLLSLPIPPVEAVIALSIVFLAHEIAVGDHASWTWRHPVAVSSSFGLLHGFGFASVLSEIGLPQTERTSALLFFNLGVEIGQITFVLALTVLATMTEVIFRQPRSALLDHRAGNQWTSYVIGIVASLWLMDRLAGF